MKLFFDTHGNDKQKAACRAWADPNISEIVYGGAKYSGKSYLECNLIFSDALTYDGTHYFIARHALNDLRKYTTPTIYKVFKDWRLNVDDYMKYNGQDNVWILKNGSKVFFLDASFLPSDPLFERFGSMDMTRGAIEEAGELCRDAKNNLHASIGRMMNADYNMHGKLIQSCNPSKNYLYTDYYLPFKKGTLSNNIAFIQAYPTDNKTPGSKEYVANLNRILTHNQRERLLLGNWEFDDDPSALCDYDAICDAFTNEHVLPTGKKSISADLAMQGRDKFVAGLWEGNICDVRIDKSKSSGKDIEISLKALMISDHVGQSQTIVDGDGMGNYLESYLNGIKSFHNGGKAINDKEFANLKSECAYKLAELINKRELKIMCTSEQQELIAEELGQLKALDVDADEQRKRIVKKEKMKESLGRSPDYLDMLIMGMYFKIVKTKVFGYSW